MQKKRRGKKRAGSTPKRAGRRKKEPPEKAFSLSDFKGGGKGRKKRKGIPPH